MLSQHQSQYNKSNQKVIYKHRKLSPSCVSLETNIKYTGNRYEQGFLNGLQCRSKLDNWGPTHIHIFVFTDHKNNAEHEYMNMSPPPQLSNLLRHRLCASVGSRKQKLVLVYFIKEFVDGKYRVYILYRFIRPEGLFTLAIFAAISSDG